MPSCRLPRQTGDRQQIKPMWKWNETEDTFCVPAEAAGEAFNFFGIKERWISVQVEKGIFQLCFTVAVI